MEGYVSGGMLRQLREERKLPQRQLAEELGVSDKTVSKWETERGLPDVSLLEPLARALGVSLSELMAGRRTVNRNRSGNPLRGRFYLCPVCGNVIWSMGEGAYSCCGVALPPLEEEEPDEDHALRAETVDGEWYITLDHPMEKEHFLSFAALVTSGGVTLHKLYPEQAAEVRFPRRGGGKLYVCCSRHGLYAVRLKR